MVSRTTKLLNTRVVTSQTLLQWNNSPRRIRAGMTIKSHPVRYQGDLGIEDRSLVFRGNDLIEEIHCEEVIPFDSIIEVILPFDEYTQANIDPWFNIGVPVTFIVHHQIDSGERTIYFTT